MKNILSLFLILILFNCEAQFINSYAYNEQRAIGQIVNDNFARGSIGASYTAVGASTWACNGSALTVTGGSGVATDRLRYNYGHSSENHTQVVVAQLTSVPSTTSFGFGPGYHDYSSPDGQRSVYIRLVTNSNAGANLGKAQIITYDGTTATLRNTSSSALTINQNDVFTFTITKNIVAGAENFDVTVARQAGGSISVSWSEVLTIAGSTAGSLSYSTGDFALYSIGGNWTISNWTITLSDKKNIDALFIGDSITHGAYATSLSNRWASIVGPHFNGFEVSAGSGDVTQRVLDKMTNILAMNPHRVFLMIGGNDILFSVAQATREANYTSIRNQLVSAGIQVIHCYATPRNATDMTGWNTFLATFTSDTRIDTFTPLKGSGTSLNATYDAGDGTHPNDAGQALVASTILPSF